MQKDTKTQNNLFFANLWITQMLAFRGNPTPGSDLNHSSSHAIKLFQLLIILSILSHDRLK